MRRRGAWLLPLLLCVPPSPAAANPAKLRVHLVPHTHDDVGWLKTVDQYYKGLNNTYQTVCVEYIIDSVYEYLKADPAKTFTYVEIAFFERWWREQDEETKAKTKELVKNGQLAFANGGWCMHDEATTDFVAMLDQTTRGHRFLQNNLDYLPSVGWQVDPFGHSHTQATLLSRGVGFDAWYFGREDYGDLLRRKQPSAHELEFAWVQRGGSAAHGGDPALAGLMESGNYGPPPQFNWDWTRGGDDGIQDDPSLEDYNVDRLVDLFVADAFAFHALFRGEHDGLCRLCGNCGDDAAGTAPPDGAPRWCQSLPPGFKGAKAGTANVMMKMGTDFNYATGKGWFKNMDRLIKHANAMYGDHVELFYSTPVQYTKARHEEELTWPCYGDDVAANDLFPYAHRPHSYWTGYFTSRPALKGYVYEMQRLFYAARVLGVRVQSAARALPRLAVSPSTLLDPLEAALGLVQHHDGVSGTEKQHVADDYARHLAVGYAKAMPFVTSAMQQLHSGTASANLAFEPCPLANVSLCAPAEALVPGGSAKRVVVLLFNPDSVERVEHMCVPVTNAGAAFAVRALDASYAPGDSVDAQVVPLNAAQRAYRARYERSDPSAFAARSDGGNAAELVFVAKVPPRGTAAYGIYLDSRDSASASTTFPASSLRGRTALHPVRRGEDLRATHEESSAGPSLVVEDGDVVAIRMPDGAELPFNITVGLYNSSNYPMSQMMDDSDNQWPVGRAGAALPVPSVGSFNQPSGAYIFRPNSSEPERLGAKPELTAVTSGPLVTELSVVFDEALAATLRVYRDAASAVEVQWYAGPLMETDGQKDLAGAEPTFSYDTGGAIASDGKFTTDSNGFRGMPRKRGTKPVFRDIDEPASGNYYPLTAFATVQDAQRGLAVVVDRPCGGSSLRDGQLEVMVHRRLKVDDSLGVGEALDESECLPEAGATGLVCKGLMVTGKHRVVAGASSAMAGLVRGVQRRTRHPLVALFAADEGSTTVGGVPAAPFQPLSPDVYVASVEILPRAQSMPSHAGPVAFVRVAHADPDADPSASVQVDLEAVLGLGRLTAVTETTLSGTQSAAAYGRRALRWRAPCVAPPPSLSSPPVGTSANVSLAPGVVRGFEAAFEVASAASA